MKFEELLAQETRSKLRYRPDLYNTLDGVGIYKPTLKVIDHEGRILQSAANYERLKLLWRCYEKSGATTPQDYSSTQVAEILGHKRFHWNEAGRKLMIRDRLLEHEPIYCTSPRAADMLCDLLSEKFPVPEGREEELLR